MSLDDERVRFYLRHRDRIEEWAALRSEAAAAVDEWLLGLEPEMRVIAAEAGAELHFVDDADNAWPAFRLRRSSWPDHATVSIGLEWGRGRTTMRTPALPYAGLRAPKQDALGAKMREFEPLRRARASRKDVPSPWWVGYSLIAPSAAFPEDAAAYREVVVAAVRGAWSAYAGAVDDFLRSQGGER